MILALLLVAMLVGCGSTGTTKSAGATTATGSSDKSSSSESADKPSSSESNDKPSSSESNDKPSGDGKVWPNGTPTVTVGFGAGGGTDTAVRPVIAEMEKYLGETINVLNQDGAASAVAATNVLNKPHDGYSMFATGSGAFAGFGVNDTSDSDWTDWASFHAFTGPAAIVVNPNGNIKSLDDLKNYLSQGTQNFAIGSFGNGPHVQIEAILQLLGIDSVNYMTLGSCRDAGVSVVSGDAEVAIGSFSALIDFVNAEQLNALCVTTADGWTLSSGGKVGETIPSITTLIEGADAIPQLCETWPIMIPRDAPQNIIDKVEEAFKYALTTDAIKEFAKEKGYIVVGYTGEEADRFQAMQTCAYSWVQYDSGLVSISPESLNLPRLEDFDWEVEKAKLNK
ncbi:MAG: Bug family tripartite tricarboxylate transporter substrate binding protein [Acetivibrionales bacterium]